VEVLNGTLIGVRQDGLALRHERVAQIKLKPHVAFRVLNPRHVVINVQLLAGYFEIEKQKGFRKHVEALRSLPAEVEEYFFLFLLQYQFILMVLLQRFKHQIEAFVIALGNEL